MKQPMRYFSIGLLTASVILLLAFYFFDNSTTSTDDLPVEEMIEAIKADGYHVVSEKEYIALSVNDEDDNKANDKKEDKDKNEEDKKQEEESDKKTRSEEHTSELQSRGQLVCRLLREKKKKHRRETTKL